jgi:hypothetical protein
VVTESYRVPTLSVDVTLLLSDGRREEVSLFLSTLSPHHPGSETLDEFFNAERQFLPVRSRTRDRSFLVNRDEVLLAEVPSDAPALFRTEGWVSSSVDFVRLELESGVAVEGTLAMALPSETPRISDFFNLKESFLVVELGDKMVYANKRRIISVAF